MTLAGTGHLKASLRLEDHVILMPDTFVLVVDKRHQF